MTINNRSMKSGSASRSSRRTRWRRQSGQAIVETAFVLLLFLFVLFAIFDFSTLFYVYLSLEHGISQAGRYGITGQTREDPQNPGYSLTREDSIKLVMREAVPTISIPDDCFAFEHFDGSNWSAGAGGPGEIARLTVTYNWKPITPLISALVSDEQIPLRVASTMKSENYPQP